MTISRMEYEERYGEEVGRCNIHKVMIVDRSCDQCEDELKQSEDAARCIECEEIRIDEYGDIDIRVEAGMKCGVCAYG